MDSPLDSLIEENRKLREESREMRAYLRDLMAHHLKERVRVAELLLRHTQEAKEILSNGHTKSATQSKDATRQNTTPLFYK
jgi:hypothetical protein